MKVGDLSVRSLIKHYLLVVFITISATISTAICTVNKNA